MIPHQTADLKPHPTQHALRQISVALAVLGICVGFLLSSGVLSGDEAGRVNLLYLLLLFAILPVAGLLLSLLLMLRGGGQGLAGLLLAIPLWPRHLTLALPGLGSARDRKLWMFYQTQIFSLGFSVGCLLLYLLLLLGTDLTFVWRSTLLVPADLFPTLQVLAWPWSFWPEAQPSLALLETTRDYRIDELRLDAFRIDSQVAIESTVGLWWQYILAAQISYSLLPRSVMLVVARTLYVRGRRQTAAGLATAATIHNRGTTGNEVILADVTATVTAPYILLDWAITPASCQTQVQQQLGAAAQVHPIGPLPQTPELIPDHSHSLVVLVKSWEPPLGELADRLRTLESTRDKLLLPLDWNDSRATPPAPAHLNEWRRFAATLSGWRVLQFEDRP